jgi:hypothetical protein
MGSARRALDNNPNLAEEERLRTKQLLEKNVQRALGRLKVNRSDGARNQAYVKALIRLNEFLLKERALIVPGGN